MENWLKAKKGDQQAKIKREKGKNTTPIIDNASIKTAQILESDHSFVEVPEVDDLEIKDTPIKETKKYTPVELEII